MRPFLGRSLARETSSATRYPLAAEHWYSRAVAHANLLTDEPGKESTTDGFRWRATRVGKRIGAAQIGGTLYEVADGEQLFPYHFHHGIEEWLYVVAGAPTVRTPDGEQVLQSGDVICFPDGPTGAHSVRGPGRVLIISTIRVPITAVYPDSGKIGVFPTQERADGKLFREADTVDYWLGETPSAQP